MTIQIQCALPSCVKLGVCRCSVCKIWYCSRECQAAHWPSHWRDCLPLPPLEWPDVDVPSCNQTVNNEAEEMQKVGIAKLSPIEVDTSPNDQGGEVVMDSVSTKPNVEVGKGKDELPRSKQDKHASKDNEKLEKLSDPVSVIVTTPAAEPVDSNKIRNAVPDVEAPPETKAPVPKKEVSTPKSSGMYSEAYYSPKIAHQVLTKNAHEIVPVDQITSPSNFIVRLFTEDEDCVKMLTLLNDNPPPAPDGWKIGRNETVAVYFEDVWYRAMAVKKNGSKFLCYLIDFGNLTTISLDLIRPLPEEYLAIPPFAYQVCLAGFGPMDGQNFTEEINETFAGVLSADANYKFIAEFLGQTEGGRWIVKLKGKDDDELLTDLLIDSELGVRREDVVAKSIEELMVSKTNTTESIKPTPSQNVPERAVALQGEAKAPALVAEKPPTAPVSVSDTKSNDPVTGPVIPRGSLESGSNDQGGVCFFESPNVFFVCPSSCLDIFTSILEKSQEEVPGSVNPVVGTCCLALDDDTCWYRGEILSVTPDKKVATLFLIDYGKEVVSEVTKLKPLAADMKVPGLVVKVLLRGVKPADGEKWQEVERDGSVIVLDVGGETIFSFRNVQNVDGVCHVDLEDLEGNDVAQFMIETGCAAEDAIEGAEIKTSSLELGKIELLVLGVVSPMELYLVTEQQFDQYSDFVAPIIAEAAANADYVLKTKVGDLVLALNDDFWCRAKVVSINEDNIEVDLFDLAIIKVVKKTDLRKASANVIQYPQMAVKCCLSSWFGKNEQEAKDEMGNKIQELVEIYSKVEAIVVENCENVTKVKIESVEEKLMKKPAAALSRADLLKMRLKKS